MCNMAAYAGKFPAAPVLIDMIRSQEYLFGGHYTGIATVHDSKIYMYKVIGTVDDLLRRYPEVLDMPGNVGIIHSRTPGFDGDRFAQPFISFDEKVVYCANGISGIFSTGAHRDFYNKTRDMGISYKTAYLADKEKYPVMDDGLSIHTSELMSNAVALYHAAGNNLCRSVSCASIDLKSEIAALALSVDEEQSVTALRINQPLVAGRDNDGFCLATSAFAFENRKISWMNVLPYASVAKICCDEIRIYPMDEFAGYFASAIPTSEVYRKLDDMLCCQDGYTVFELAQKAKECWAAGELAQHFHIVYNYLWEKSASGNLEFTDKLVPGSNSGLTAPERRFKLKIRS